MGPRLPPSWPSLSRVRRPVAAVAGLALAMAWLGPMAPAIHGSEAQGARDHGGHHDGGHVQGSHVHGTHDATHPDPAHLEAAHLEAAHLDPAHLDAARNIPAHTDPARPADHDHPDLEVDMEARTITLVARAHPEAFEAGLPPDHQYHGLVNVDGSAAAKSLFTTAVPDSTLARVFRAMGAQDGGGVPMAAWNLRWVPLVPQPSARVQGTPVSITVEWEGSDGAVPLSELLRDPGGQGIDLRFGGNEEHDDHWHSGCIVCLYSCPGGVISNAAYSIRDHQRGATLFLPTDRMPPEGTRIRITFVLDST